MMRGAWFGRRSGPTTSSSSKKKKATPTPKAAPVRNSSDGTSIYHARPRPTAASGAPPASPAFPPPLAMARTEGPVRRPQSPPAPPVPLTPAPRIMRLFPEYEIYVEDNERGLGDLQYQMEYQQLYQHLQPQQAQQQQQQQRATPKKEAEKVTLPDGQKGLENNKGEYNCFINVVIQALWHLTAFRERFVSGTIEQHECTGTESCVHCALQTIFAQYQFSEKCIIPPTSLRKALAVLYKNEARFQLNEIDDAAEALEAILNKLHHSHRSKKEQEVAAPLLEKKACPCLVHNTFGVRTMDLLRCETCGATTEPSATSLFMAYAYTFALRETREKAGAQNLSFCQLINQSSQQDRRWCPNAERCNKMCAVEHHLLYLPKVFSVGLVWTSPEGAPKKEIEEVLDMITMEIDLSNIFIANTAIARYLQSENGKRTQSSSLSAKSITDIASSLTSSGLLDSLVDSTDSMDTSPRKTKRKVKCLYELRGMICYYGQHYSCYFNSPITKQWYVFDDVMVKAVGTDWSAVKERCLRGHLQPSVLFYEKKEVVEEECPVEEDIIVQATINPEQPSTGQGVEVEEPTQPQAVWDGEEALKKTMAAEILEMLMAGEEEWKREKERERELVKVREAEEKLRLEMEEQERQEALLQVPDIDDEEESPNEEEEGDLDDEGLPEDKDQLNGSWFVRPTQDSIPKQEDDEAQQEVKTIADEDTQEPEATLEESRLKRVPSTLDGHSCGEDSDWEFIGTDRSEHADGNDDVEIIFENEKTPRVAKPKQELSTRLQHRHHDELPSSDQDDVEIVEGDDERGGRHSKLRRRTSSFTFLSSSESDGLDSSFTLINDRGSSTDHVDVEVTHTNWLYRRHTKLYRLTRDELLYIDQDTQAVKESFRYDEIAQILMYGSLAMVIRMKPDCGKSCGYIDGHGAEQIADLLCASNPDITLKRQ